MNLRWIGLLVAALLGLAAHAGAETPPVTAGATLRQIQTAGELHCGVVVAREDWNKVDLHGDLSSLDVEICKAVGIAVLGTRAKIDITTFNSELEAEQGLNHSRVELVVGVTPSASAAAHWQVAFGPPVFYDGLAVLVRPGVPADAPQRSCRPQDLRDRWHRKRPRPGSARRHFSGQVARFDVAGRGRDGRCDGDSLV